jgi:hypothetical protein
MVRYATVFLMGALVALVFQPWLFPDGFMAIFQGTFNR